ncbi:ATP-grasp domain-containing protein [Actinokineospora xionganensis]|uniref:ATP-grasp domain-containing protein n=1 Tax=Actinokineospora xionganensis TaxID=2684470 RepID=A0ABR7L056_9PSEU|nr:hypothetical protein [Actinokineospora xionganensis]MBC6446019.1 hypothetical protein [Actinokineospora xionganensis]
MERVAVIYDVGAATPTEILASLLDTVEPVFVLSDSQRELAELLADVADVSTFNDVAALEPRGVITFSDYHLERAADLAATLGLPFHSVDTARNLTRKYLQRNILNAHGVGYTATALVTSVDTAAQAAGAVEFPAVLKPDRGFGGTDTYLVHSRRELLDIAAGLFGRADGESDTEYVLETLLPGIDLEPPWGDYVSVESVVQGGTIRHLAVTGKLALSPPFREQGSLLPAAPHTFDHAEVLDLATRALVALDVGDSVCHTEVKLTPMGPRIIEVNGRLGHPLYDLFMRAHNIDLIQVATQIALGRTPAFDLTPSDDVVYHYFGLPPVGATRLLEPPSQARLRATPEVDHFELLIKPGTPVDWRRGFRERTYTCLGRTATHADLATFVTDLDTTLGVEYET